MFIVNYFKNSFFPKRILSMRKEKFWKVLIFFLLLSIISLFPFNIKNLEGGFKSGLTEENLTGYPLPNLPEGVKLGLLFGVITPNDEEIIYNRQFNETDITYYFNYKGSVDDFKKLNKQSIAFTKEQVLYTNGRGNILPGNYHGFIEEVVNFSEINLLLENEKQAALINLSSYIESAFARYNAVYSIAIYSIIQISMYILMIIILAAITQLYRFKYGVFMSFLESVKVIVFCMTIPALLSFIVGIFVHFSFVPIIFQFGSGVLLMFLLIKYGDKEFA